MIINIIAEIITAKCYFFLVGYYKEDSLYKVLVVFISNAEFQFKVSFRLWLVSGIFFYFLLYKYFINRAKSFSPRNLNPSKIAKTRTSAIGIIKANAVLAYKKYSFEKIFDIKQSDEKLDYSAEFPACVKELI